MNEIAEQFLSELGTSLPGSNAYWEKEPTTASGLDGAVLTAEYQNRKFTVQFERAAGNADQELDPSFIEQVVDDFVDFFARTIYPKEKFTRII